MVRMEPIICPACHAKSLYRSFYANIWRCRECNHKVDTSDIIWAEDNRSHYKVKGGKMK